jgi:transcriptional regulator with XRE-family HTH domain
MTRDGRILLDSSLLKTFRRMHGLSQEALAQLCFDRRLCVSIASIKRAEAGKALLYRTARNLALVYEVPLQQLAIVPAGSPTVLDTVVLDAHAASRLAE